jgi:hypothetical protein
MKNTILKQLPTNNVPALLVFWFACCVKKRFTYNKYAHFFYHNRQTKILRNPGTLFIVSCLSIYNKIVRYSYRNIFLPIILFFLATVIPAKNVNSASNDKQISKVNSTFFRLELRPFAINTTEAFLQARGFSQTQAAMVAKVACIHKLEIHNTAEQTDNKAITINLKKWMVVANTSPHYPMIRESWPSKWQKKFANNMPPKHAKIAFNWALFPTNQIFWASDYNWGLIAFGLNANTKFDLQLTWQVDKQVYNKTLKNLNCGK